MDPVAELHKIIGKVICESSTESKTLEFIEFRLKLLLALFPKEAVELVEQFRDISSIEQIVNTANITAVKLIDSIKLSTEDSVGVIASKIMAKMERSDVAILTMRSVMEHDKSADPYEIFNKFMSFTINKAQEDLAFIANLNEQTRDGVMDNLLYLAPENYGMYIYDFESGIVVITSEQACEAYFNLD